LRGTVGIEQMKGNREQLVITEIPYNVNRAALEEQTSSEDDDEEDEDIEQQKAHVVELIEGLDDAHLHMLAGQLQEMGLIAAPVEMEPVHQDAAAGRPPCRSP
jgi:hypothetical protein